MRITYYVSLIKESKINALLSKITHQKNVLKNEVVIIPNRAVDGD